MHSLYVKTIVKMGKKPPQENIGTTSTSTKTYPQKVFTRITRPMSLMEQELVTLPERLSSPLVLSRVRLGHDFQLLGIAAGNLCYMK